MTSIGGATPQQFVGRHRTAALLAAIPQDDGADALLTYAALVDPDPLQVNAAAVIRLMVSNSGSAPVTVKQIDITIPRGTTAKALARSLDGIQVDVPDEWDASRDGETITLTPQTEQAAEMRGKALKVVISAFTVNGEPGTSQIRIAETASSRAKQQDTRAARLTVPKFPEQFHVSDLDASPDEVATGGAATLDWTGTATDTSYRIEYQPADEGKPVSRTVGSSGPYLAENLRRRDMVRFTLVVEVKVPGQDRPLVARRHAFVNVATLSLDLSVAPTKVAPNGIARLRWTTTNAESCTLDSTGEALPRNGEMYVLVTPEANTFYVTARGSGGASKQDWRAVTIDPTIKPTEPARTATGEPGHRGAPFSVNGPGEGGRGGDAVLRAVIAPLQEAGPPARVIPLVVTGGRGGQGGDGGWAQLDDGVVVMSGGAPGGRGGDARIEAEIDPALPPAQYIVTLTPGAGGPGGNGFASMPAGVPGKAGSTHMRIGAPGLAHHAALHAPWLDEQPGPAATSTVIVASIPQDPGAAALLRYALLVHPDPLQVGERGTMTLVVSNPGSGKVTVQRIEVWLPLGNTGKTLTQSTTGIDVPVPDGWEARVDGEVIAFAPTAGTAEVGKSLTFELAGVIVNDSVGTCVVEIHETASTKAQPVLERTAQLSVPKFPQRFRVGELHADPRQVATGGSATLDWSGTAKDATYTLEYQPADDGPMVSQEVDASGTWLAENLTRKNSVYFTLIVRVKVIGQDAPLTVHRYAQVTVLTLSLDLSVTPVTVPPNGLARLRWKSPNAISCTLNPGGVALANSGEMWLVVKPGWEKITVTADGPGGSFDQKQFEFTVDPSLKATESGYGISGAAGGRGDPYRCVPPKSFPAGAGQKGGEAVLRGKIPPLDDKGVSARVIPITLRGGVGGQGGPGGWCNDPSYPRAIWEVPGGPGGEGGDAGIDAEFDPSLPPARYIVILAPGAGGPHGGAVRYFTPPDGKPGSTYIRIARPVGANAD